MLGALVFSEKFPCAIFPIVPLGFCTNTEKLSSYKSFKDLGPANFLERLNCKCVSFAFQCEFYFSDSHEVASFNGEQPKHLNDHVPLVDVSFPEATEKLISFRDSVAMEQTQNLKHVQRLSTALQKADSPDRSDCVNLTMSNGYNIQKRNANCDSNGLESVTINDEGSTSEATAGEVNFTTTQNNGKGNNKEVKRSCISIPTCATKDQESLRKRRHLSYIANNAITVKYFSQLSETDDNQHKGICENVNPSSFDAERCDV